MNYRNILKVYKLERDLSDDETALLNTLRGMTDAERELFAETLQPEKAVKALTKERKIEKCEVCNFTRRAMVHQVPSAEGFHEFQTPQPATKSRRASSLKEKIGGTVASIAKTVGGSAEGARAVVDVLDKAVSGTRCYATVDDNGGEMTCGKPEDDSVHDTRYLSSHPFVRDARPATRPSAANGGGENSTANSVAETVSAGVAVGGSNSE